MSKSGDENSNSNGILYNKVKLTERLGDLRNNKGLSLAQLSQGILEKTKVSISPTQLGKYENPDNSVIISLNNLFALANYYEVSIYNLLGMNDCKKADNEEIHKRLGLSDEAIEVLETEALEINRKPKEFDIIHEIRKQAHYTINFLLENDLKYNSFNDIGNFLWFKKKNKEVIEQKQDIINDDFGYEMSIKQWEAMQKITLDEKLYSMKYDIEKEAKNNTKDNKKKK